MLSLPEALELVKSYFGDLNDPIFIGLFALVTILATVTWILSLVERNSSQVDRIWPIMPTVYSLAYIYVGVNYYGLDLNNDNLIRLIGITALLSVWSVRLTVYFWKKGYYKRAHEDYRWTKVRKSYGPVRFFVFNCLFIGYFQNWVLFSLNIPMWFVIKHSASNEPLNMADYVLFVLLAFFVAFEAIADQQQWSFQTNKYRWIESEKSGVSKKQSKSYSAREIEDFKRGFLVRGLFKYSRHPNYFGDLAIFWTIYFFSLSSQLTSLTKSGLAVHSLVNWSIIAIAFFSWLFQCSCNITERLSSKKYPEYKIYQSKVSRMIPFFTTYNPGSETKKSS